MNLAKFSRRSILMALTALGGCVPYSSGSLKTLPLSDEALLDDIHRRTFNFFWETTDHKTGLTPDRWPTKTFSSIAAIGFGLTAYCIGVKHGYISRQQAAERTRNTLRFLYQAPQGEMATGVAGHKGYFYHFLTYDQGVRYRNCELSSIDTALLIMGALCAAQYFSEDVPVEQEIRDLSSALYERIDWNFMMRPSGRQSMGWHPETGFIKAEWGGYNEGIMIYLLGLASATHPMPDSAYEAWMRTYDDYYITGLGAPHLGFHALFAHQYDHVWIDFRGLGDAYMQAKGFDYFENSRRATLGQREYAIENPQKFVAYGPDIWGLTACDGPADVTLTLQGLKRQFRSYSARGPGVPETFDDGTIAPTAAISSIVFTPSESIQATQAMYQRFGKDIYGQYGFFDAFNPTFVTPYPSKEGRQTPSAGWVSYDYLGIDQGPILAMIENYRSGFIWEIMRNNKILRKGLQRAGFAPMSPQGQWMKEG